MLPLIGMFAVASSHAASTEDAQASQPNMVVADNHDQTTMTTNATDASTATTDQKTEEHHKAKKSHGHHSKKHHDADATTAKGEKTSDVKAADAKTNSNTNDNVDHD